MGIKLTLEVVSPLDPEDRELLSGCAVMVLAIANHEMAKDAFPALFSDEDETEEARSDPQPCAHADPTGEQLCINVAGHRGRHKYRPFGAVGAELAN
ncbi:MAG: hypothetical protein WCH74_07265 [Chloroflexota bacterium]